MSHGRISKTRSTLRGNEAWRIHGAALEYSRSIHVRTNDAPTRSNTVKRTEHDRGPRCAWPGHTQTFSAAIKHPQTPPNTGKHTRTGARYTLEYTRVYLRGLVRPHRHKILLPLQHPFQPPLFGPFIPSPLLSLSPLLFFTSFTPYSHGILPPLPFLLVLHLSPLLRFLWLRSRSFLPRFFRSFCATLKRLLHRAWLKVTDSCSAHQRSLVLDSLPIEIRVCLTARMCRRVQPVFPASLLPRSVDFEGAGGTLAIVPSGVNSAFLEKRRWNGAIRVSESSLSFLRSKLCPTRISSSRKITRIRCFEYVGRNLNSLPRRSHLHGENLNNRDLGYCTIRLCSLFDYKCLSLSK